MSARRRLPIECSQSIDFSQPVRSCLNAIVIRPAVMTIEVAFPFAEEIRNQRTQFRINRDLKYGAPRPFHVRHALKL
jgi:hypothetical protein